MLLRFGLVWFGLVWAACLVLATTLTPHTSRLSPSEASALNAARLATSRNAAKAAGWVHLLLLSLWGSWCLDGSCFWFCLNLAPLALTPWLQDCAVLFAGLSGRSLAAAQGGVSANERIIVTI
jgi:hypothetical protein